MAQAFVSKVFAERKRRKLEKNQKEENSDRIPETKEVESVLEKLCHEFLNKVEENPDKKRLEQICEQLTGFLNSSLGKFNNVILNSIIHLFCW